MKPELERKVISLMHNVRFGGLPAHYPSIAAWDAPGPGRGEIVRSWRRALAAGRGRPLGIYLNVPFCRARCRFCFLDVTPAAPGAPEVERYAAAAEAEMRLYAGLFAGREIGSVYIGGGTPNALSAEQLARLLAALRGNFRLKPGLQISMEANPDFFDAEKLEALADGGVTMLLLGIQSFSQRINAASGRAQDVTKIEKAFSLIRAAGIGQINADLLCGLPGQKRAEFLDDVRRLAALRPTQIHLNRIKPLAGALPLTLKLELNAWQVEGLGMLRRAGYTLLDEESGCLGGERNLQGDYRFHRDGSLLGLGPCALSHARGGVRYQNISTPEAYARAVEAGQFPVLRGVKLSAEDELRHYLIGELLHGETVTAAGVSKLFGAAAGRKFAALAAALARDGALEGTAGGWRCALNSGDWLPVTAGLYEPRWLEKIALRYFSK